MPLTDRDRAILDFERGWWMLPVSKSAGIREHLNLSPTRYYQRLNTLLDDSDAVAYDPLVVHRLRRMRLQRRRARFVGRTSLEHGQ